MKTNIDKSAMAAGAGALILLAIGIIILGPLFTIWSWNQLFGDIKMVDYNFWNWLAVIGLGMFFKSTIKTSKSN